MSILITDMKIGQTIKTRYFSNVVADLKKVSDTIFELSYQDMAPSVIQGQMTVRDQTDVFEIDYKTQLLIEQKQLFSADDKCKFYNWEVKIISTKELIKELTERFYNISIDEFKELHEEVQELSKVIESNTLLLT